jgi:hypothetical protein
MTDREAAKLVELAQAYKEAQNTLNRVELNLTLATKAHEQASLTYINAKARLADIVQRVSE